MIQLSVLLQTVGDFLSEYQRRVALNESDNHSSYAYDAIWAMALALNRSLAKFPLGTRLGDLSYGDKAAMDVITGLLLDTEFYGITVSWTV